MMMSGYHANGQSIYEVIDSTKTEIAVRCEFIRNYFSSSNDDAGPFGIQSTKMRKTTTMPYLLTLYPEISAPKI